jgi:hypothetical protein
MLISIFLAYLYLHFDSGSPSPELLWPYDATAKLIQQDVADEARQKQALEIVDRMKAVNVAYDKQLEASIAALVKLEAVRATPVSAITDAGRSLVTDDKAIAEKLLDFRFELKAVLTSSEWAKVFPAPAATAAIDKKKP